MAACFLAACALSLGAPEGRAHSLLGRRVVVAFYYLWYGTPDVDGRWLHWDHTVLPHWNPKWRERFPHGQPHSPPDAPHAPFQPALGPYSSRNVTVLSTHMAALSGAGVDAVAISWTGREGGATSDTQGVYTDALVPLVLSAALAHGMRVAFHLEPYPGRTAASLREDVFYLTDTYASGAAGEALLRDERGRAVYFVYDAYHIPMDDWASLLLEGGERTIRGTPGDGMFVGLALSLAEATAMARAGWDGIYSYFAADGFTELSTRRRWTDIARALAGAGVVFVPCVGPGYNDTLIRPWNADSTRSRRKGAYYAEGLDAAARALEAAGGEMAAITSFNEFGEGTQIEACVPHERGDGTAAVDYSDTAYGPDHYLRMTRVGALGQWRASGAPGTLGRGAPPHLEL